MRQYTPQCVNMSGDQKQLCVDGTCPNVCSQVIKAQGGNISIVKNIHLVTKLF